MSMSFGTYFGDPVIILTEFCNITKLLKCNLKLLNCVSTFTDGSDLKKKKNKSVQELLEMKLPDQSINPTK